MTDPFISVLVDQHTVTGHNHLGDSGTTDSIPGLHPWLNSTGSFSDEGFYQAFSESFKNSIIVTDVPNREWSRYLFPMVTLLNFQF